MIDQKAREIEQAASFMPYSGRRGIGYEAARLGIIEGRRQAFEEAAKVADEQAINRQRVMDHLPEGHSNSYSHGAKIAAESIAQSIRALIGETI